MIQATDEATTKLVTKLVEHLKDNLTNEVALIWEDAGDLSKLLDVIYDLFQDADYRPSGGRYHDLERISTLLSAAKKNAQLLVNQLDAVEVIPEGCKPLIEDAA